MSSVLGKLTLGLILVGALLETSLGIRLLTEYVSKVLFKDEIGNNRLLGFGLIIPGFILIGIVFLYLLAIDKEEGDK